MAIICLCTFLGCLPRSPYIASKLVDFLTTSIFRRNFQCTFSISFDWVLNIISAPLFKIEPIRLSKIFSLSCVSNSI